MSVRESIVRAFLKLNIFARTPEVEIVKKTVYLTENEAMEEMVAKVRESKEYQEALAKLKNEEKDNPFNF